MTVLFDPEITADEFKGRRVTIVGLGKGRTTAGLARYLVGKGARVTITDPKREDDLAEGIARLGETAKEVELVLGPSSDDLALAEPDFVFVIPGIRPRSPTILRALQRRVPVLTEIALFFRLCPATIVGITGTKGKTTTTTLVERVLARGTRRVIVGGNIGTPVIQELEDHLDHHGTRDAYIAAKRNIVAWQGPRDVAVLNLDDPATVSLHTGAASEVRGFSLSLQPRRGAYLDPQGRLVLVSGDRHSVVCEAKDLRVPGKHNVANALAAAIVGDVFDVPVRAIGDVLRAFEGVPRRLETVGEIDGVLWVNDSAATTPSATISALDAFDRPAVVILGGVAKGADFTMLAREVVRRARGAVLIGQAADDIASALAAAGAAGSQLAVAKAPTLAEAVTNARALARPGDVVLLSPACAAREDYSGGASLDHFTSVDDRGDRFVALVRELMGVKA
ncbi:MAG: hypothetical protein E6H94_03220 [Chloroflexi bacterium]|nr:MAG: hypothetical protein E6H94_03220 [Chloroflexota bacterium]